MRSVNSVKSIVVPTEKPVILLVFVNEAQLELGPWGAIKEQSRC
jgi:hypothetical protein